LHLSQIRFSKGGWEWLLKLQSPLGFRLFLLLFPVKKRKNLNV